MRRWYWGLALAVIVAGGWLGRDWFFETETVRIRRVLQQLALEVSFGADEENLAAVRRVAGVMDRFAPDARIEVELMGEPTVHLSGRGEIQQGLMGMRRDVRRLALQFHDLVIQPGGDGQTAAVHLTATVDTEGRRRRLSGFDATELKVELGKIEGRWRVQQVRTVPTLKQ